MMAGKKKCVIVTILAVQITLFVAYFALANHRPTMLFNCRISGGNSNSEPWNSNFSSLLDKVPTSLWEVVEGRSNNTPGSAGVLSGSGTENLPTFQQIDNRSVWMYSAFFDDVAAKQGNPMIRVIGIVYKTDFQNIYCNLSTHNGSLQVTGKILPLPESHGTPYTASYIECPLPAGMRPMHVSVSYIQNSTARCRFKITYPSIRSRNFTVCHSVLYGNFSQKSQIIESIEMNRILGAEHFFIYNYSISPEVDQILRRYQKDGLVTVLPWPVPTLQVHYYGQLAALNDCSHRNRNVSRFIVVVDTDELIIPRNNLSWMELIYSISPQEYDISVFMHPSEPAKQGQKTTASFFVRSSFFASVINWTAVPSQFSFTNEEKNNTRRFEIKTLSQLFRSKHIYPQRDRTKYFTRPEQVYACGIHFVHIFTGKIWGIEVNSDLALVHHYRTWDIKDYIPDTSILKFKGQLYPRVMNQIKRFAEIFP